MASGARKRGSGNTANIAGLPIPDDTAAASGTSIGRNPDEGVSSAPEAHLTIEEGGERTGASGTDLQAVPVAQIIAAVETSPSRPVPAERQTSGTVRLEMANLATLRESPSQANEITTSNKTDIVIYLDAGAELSNILAASFNISAMINNVFLYPGIGFSVISSICTLFKNAAEAEKELNEQDLTDKEIATLIENSRVEKIEIDLKAFKKFKEDYHPVGKLNRIILTIILMFIFTIGGFWCRSFLSTEDKNENSALSIIIAVNALSALINYLHRVLILQPMGGEATKKFHTMKASMLMDYKNIQSPAIKEMEGELKASEQRTKTARTTVDNLEKEIRVKDLSLMSLQAECNNLKLQLASQNNSGVTTTFATASSATINTISSGIESRV